jgi:hypothetical protein
MGMGQHQASGGVDCHRDGRQHGRTPCASSASPDPDFRAYSSEFQNDSVAIDRDCIPYGIHSGHERLVELINRPSYADGALCRGVETLGIEKPQIATLFVR